MAAPAAAARTAPEPPISAQVLAQLVWSNDPSGIELAIRALRQHSAAMQIAGASALAEYGPTLAGSAKPALLSALRTADQAARPQIAWALVALGEARAFEPALALYRSGELQKVERFDGGPAFDPSRFAALGTEELSKLDHDADANVRRLVATALGERPEARFTDTLLGLLEDGDLEVSLAAAPGLAKAEKRAHPRLIAKLAAADRDKLERYLASLRDGAGSAGLLLATAAAPQDVGKGFYFKQRILDLIHDVSDPVKGLNDPSGADALLTFIESKPHIYLQTRAAFALAALGDVRAVPTLSKRLRMDPLKIYTDQRDWEAPLMRDDNERVICARLIADLAMLHPERRAQLAEPAEAALIFWLHEQPSPHANGMRALAALRSSSGLVQLRSWSKPKTPLPRPNAPPPMPEDWVIAQSALRYVGMVRDESSFDLLTKALTLRPKNLDATMDGLLQGGVAIRGMSLRAVGVGAADGLSEWRDERGYLPLLAYIEEPLNNEQSRMGACAALAWVAKEQHFLELIQKIRSYSTQEKIDRVRHVCLLETLLQRPIPGLAPALLPLITDETKHEARQQLARAIARSGIDEEVENRLFEMMADDKLLLDAALALILGGSADAAARAVASFAGKPKGVIEELAELWYRSFGYWSSEDLERGGIFRVVDNARAIERVELDGTKQSWARLLLSRQFDNLAYDNGPHSLTRVVLRQRLWQMARGKDAEQSAAAIRTLLAMKEQGVLFALRSETGRAGEIAHAAYFELLNPVALK